MRRFLAVVLLGLTVCATAASAQVQDEIQITRSAIQTGRQAIVAKAMGLTDPQGEAFWPVYREYHAEMDKISDRAVKLVTDYAQKYATMTDADATPMVKEMLDIQKSQVALKTKFMPKFSKVLTPKLLARYYQVENKLDAIVMSEVAQEIPLVP